jgi:hypothetical protein
MCVGCAVCATRKASLAGDPSLRLKNGCAQDDFAVVDDELRHPVNSKQAQISKPTIFVGARRSLTKDKSKP